MDKPAEILLYDFLQERSDASSPDDLIYRLELHDTVYQSITKPQGIRISDAVGDIVPEPGGGLKESDVQLELACFAKVEGKEKKDRQPALIAVFEIQQAVITLLLGDQTLGGRVCDVLIKKGLRGYENLSGNPYAVANIPIVINPSGSNAGHY